MIEARLTLLQYVESARPWSSTGGLPFHQQGLDFAPFVLEQQVVCHINQQACPKMATSQDERAYQDDEMASSSCANDAYTCDLCKGNSRKCSVGIKSDSQQMLSSRIENAQHKSIDLYSNSHTGERHDIYLGSDDVKQGNYTSCRQ